jgi:hypothetical protein
MLRCLSHDRPDLQLVATSAISSAGVPEIAPPRWHLIPLPLTTAGRSRTYAAVPTSCLAAKNYGRNCPCAPRVRMRARFEATFRNVAVDRNVALYGRPAELRDDLCCVTLENKKRIKNRRRQWDRSR